MLTTTRNLDERRWHYAITFTSLNIQSVVRMSKFNIDACWVASGLRQRRSHEEKNKFERDVFAPDGECVCEAHPRTHTHTQTHARTHRTKISKIWFMSSTHRGLARIAITRQREQQRSNSSLNYKFVLFRSSKHHLLCQAICERRRAVFPASYISHSISVSSLTVSIELHADTSVEHDTLIGTLVSTYFRMFHMRKIFGECTRGALRECIDLVDIPAARRSSNDQILLWC